MNEIDFTVSKYKIGEWDEEILDSRPPYGVNWGAYGTVSAKNAKRFIVVLKKAIKEVEELNNNFKK